MPTMTKHVQRAPVQRTQGAMVDAYIYEYAPKGPDKRPHLQGYQVRFKRTIPGAKKGETNSETRSAYFSFSRFGTQERALKEAEKWRNANHRWMDDRSWKLTPVPQPKRKAA